MKFTEQDIGKKVRPTEDTVKTESDTFKSVDEVYTLTNIYGDFCCVASKDGLEHSGWFHDRFELFNASHSDIIKSNNYKKYKDMNIIDKIRVHSKGEPMKTLIKNDILTLDGRLTTTGQALFNDFLYAKFKDEFIADLAPKLEGLNDKE